MQESACAQWNTVKKLADWIINGCVLWCYTASVVVVLPLSYNALFCLYGSFPFTSTERNTNGFWYFIVDCIELDARILSNVMFLFRYLKFIKLKRKNKYQRIKCIICSAYTSIWHSIHKKSIYQFNASKWNALCMTWKTACLHATFQWNNREKKATATQRQNTCNMKRLQIWHVSYYDSQRSSFFNGIASFFSLFTC